MSADIPGLTRAVTSTAINIAAYKAVERSVKKLDRPSRKSKTKVW